MKLSVYRGGQLLEEWQPDPIPCAHCGQLQYPYNGRILAPVCQVVWTCVPKADRHAVCLPGSSSDEQDAALARIDTLARSMKVSA
jgi:hypothetical protein